MQHGTPAQAPTMPLAILTIATGALVLSTIATGDDTGGGEIALRTDDRSAESLQLAVDDLLTDSAPSVVSGGEELPLATVKFFIEFNETDEDIGVQSLIGGEPYTVLRAYGPDKRRILDLRPRRNLRQQGMSDFFFESAEPSLEEFPMEDFLARFPEGEYEFETLTLDGLEQEGETMFTHTIPAGPVITSPKEGEVVDPEKVLITWEPVTMTTAFNPPQGPVTITGYQVILTREDPLRILSADVSADTTTFVAPASFIDPGTEYEVEVLAIEESDNQTISLLFFETDE